MRPALILLTLLAATQHATDHLNPRALSAEAHRPSSALKLPRLFADGMVVQRDQPIAVWGWGDPQASVDLSFHGHRTQAKPGRDGQWHASLPREAAGGPYTLIVQSGDDRIEVRDVLVGDVWVASGQSNMEFTVSQATGGDREIAGANDSMLRQFKVPTSWANAPEDDLAGGEWTRADPKHVGSFTAVGYFFARDLRRSVGVPIGIINTTWGGSAIEAWLSRPAQRLGDSAWRAIVDAQDARTRASRDALTTKLGGLPTTDGGMSGDRAIWADPALDDDAWAEIHVPDYWEEQGYADMDGVAWYRVHISLSDSEARNGATLSFAAIDDDDITWLNGVEVGRTTGYNVHRAYRLPPGLLHAGSNVVAVRVTDLGGGGGINGAASLEFADGTRRSLAGAWKFKVGAVTFQTDGQVINKIPSVLYNKMLNPLLPFPIKGVIWYQGESNANNVSQAAAYRSQFETLIRSWREAWTGDGAGTRAALPILWVQLPNFGSADSVPPLEASWATQRESMDAALALPNTGRAVTIDVGDPADIHPRDKLTVGSRLALVARRRIYGQAVVASGPSYRSHTVRGDTVVVDFADVEGGLRTRSGDPRVEGFEIAGGDRRFVWADARIDGHRVLVWSNRVRTPVAVRYAWSNNPDRANLYNGEHLPAAPFRTDRW
jgi:sialate O-acetylesterase